MNKGQLIDYISKDSGLTKVDIQKFINSTIKVVIDVLENGDRISVKGAGSLSVVERSKRTGRNPQTGAKINIPAKKVVKFRPGHRCPPPY